MMSMRATLRKPKRALSTRAFSAAESGRTTSPQDTSSRVASPSIGSQQSRPIASSGSPDSLSSPTSSPRGSVDRSGNVSPQTTGELNHIDKGIPVATQIGVGEFIPCPPDSEILAAPLPIEAVDEERRRARMSVVGVKYYNECKDIFINRYKDAKNERARHPEYIVPKKRGRTGNNPNTKKPPKDMRVVIQWDEAYLPVGPWAKKFNNYLGCLGRRGDLFNPYFLWVYHPFSCLETAWRDVQKYFILDDNPYAWDYVFVKISRAINEHKNSIKNKYFIDINDDWERFEHLETRVDPVHFAGLLCYWDSEECKEKSKQCRDNRLQNDWDHHLGSQTYSQLVHKQKIIRNVKDLDLLERCKLGFATFSAKYNKEDKKEKNLKKVEDLSQSIDQATTQLQNAGILTENDTLPREEQLRCVEKVFGPEKKNQGRFAGVGAKLNHHVNSEMNSSRSTIGINKFHSTNSMVQKLLKRDKKRQKELEDIKKTNQFLVNLVKLSSPDLARKAEEMMQNATSSRGEKTITSEECEDEGQEEEEEDEEEDSYQDLPLS